MIALCAGASLKTELRMSIIIELAPELGERLRQEAASRGVELDRHAASLLSESVSQASAAILTGDAWVAALSELAGSVKDTQPLNPESLRREYRYNMDWDGKRLD